MELRFSRFWPEIVSPDFIDLPKIKALNMSSVAFRDGKGISNHIASCPSLEHLFLLEDGKDSCKNFVINAPKLRKLLMCYGKEWSGLQESDIKVIAPNLRTLAWCLSRGLSFIELSRLDSVSITMPFDY
ncbi:hypothetical protein Syun_021395 [Stephania yunnanensis]|uniref:F-box/LRR-repeat protein 15/At3g58940/PEG3-like LRR domain-containing protein n=1 Tax=Stephania yunnanensis TaxID=152371 RepID=A0AAP0IFP8_9MAGN